MSLEMLFVFALIAIAGALMASNRVRPDIVSLLVVLALMLSGVLTVGEALAGFGSPVIALVAGLLVIGEMLRRTGFARAVGDWVLRRGGKRESRLLILVMSCAAMLGSIMSSTAIVALFIPVVSRICSEAKLNVSRMLIPLSYAALISGMLTLIATTPNIVVHERLKSEGISGFSFFSFTPVGLAVFVVALSYILLIGRHMLGNQGDPEISRKRKRSIEDLWLQHNPGSSYQKLLINADSPLAGRSIGEVQFASNFNVRIVGLFQPSSRGKERITSPSSSVQLTAKTGLLVVGKPADIKRLTESRQLTLIPHTPNDIQRWLWDISGAAIMIHPESQLLGKSLRECRFRSNYGAHVLGMRRNGKPLDNFESIPLHTADSLFVVGHWEKIQQLFQQSDDFVVMELPREHAEIAPSYNRLKISLAIVLAMVLLILFKVVPLVPAILMASLAAIFTRCLSMEEAYRSIHWSSLVLIAGMLPLADALIKTGGSQLITETLMNLAGNAGPYLWFSLLFFLTATVGLVLSNTAAAVLVSPIAIQAASMLDVSPYPFAIAVIIAASSSFSTPVATPVVTLVVEPGNYRFTDFVRVGIPLLLLTYVTTLVVTPYLFPF